MLVFYKILYTLAFFLLVECTDCSSVGGKDKAVSLSQRHMHRAHQRWLEVSIEQMAGAKQERVCWELFIYCNSLSLSLSCNVYCRSHSVLLNPSQYLNQQIKAVSLAIRDHALKPWWLSGLEHHYNMQCPIHDQGGCEFKSQSSPVQGVSHAV